MNTDLTKKGTEYILLTGKIPITDPPHRKSLEHRLSQEGFQVRVYKEGWTPRRFTNTDPHRKGYKYRPHIGKIMNIDPIQKGFKIDPHRKGYKHKLS